LPSIASQLYGAHMPHQQQHTNPNVANLAHSTNPIEAIPRLHQVPIHIYPGMDTSFNDPMLPSQPIDQPQQNLHQHQPLPHQNAYTLAEPDFSVHLSPIQEPSLDLSMPLVTSPSLPRSLVTMLDLSALEATRVPSLHSEDSTTDEQIDFDTLWAWPNFTPVMGSPKGVEEGGGSERVHSICESTVPMFGVSKEGTYGM
jgi:hypothetical protein